MTLDDTLLEPACQFRPRKTRKRVLVVDDDRQQTEILKFRLEQLAFDVTVCHSGRKALRTAQEQTVDLVMLDLGLPDIGGLQVCSALSDDPRTCAIPVIIISGTDDPEAVRHSRAAGSRYFLRKPYDPNVLLAILEAVLVESSGDDD